jgi:hypothetical protein
MADKTNTSPISKSSGSLSKKDAVRRALQDLGNEAKPLQIREHIKKRYHLEMSLDHISTVKGEILRETGQAKPAAAKPTSTATAAAKPSTQQPAVPQRTLRTEDSAKGANSARGKEQGINLHDIETVKDLVERVGSGSLKKLIDVMAR